MQSSIAKLSNLCQGGASHCRNTCTHQFSLDSFAALPAAAGNQGNRGSWQDLGSDQEEIWHQRSRP